MAWARQQREDTKTTWENGGLTEDDHFKTAMNNSAAIGACRILAEIQALEYETIVESQKDGRESVAKGPERGY